MKQILEHVTKKQLAILQLIYRFRFLNRHHIQKFLNHKSHTLITTYLKDLTDQKILNRIYTPTIGNINKPAIYYLAPKSKPILTQAGFDSQILQRVYKEGLTSERFKTKWLFVADLHFRFQEVAQRNKMELQYLTETDLRNYAFVPLPRPDAYVVLNKKNVTKRYFVEILNSGDPYFAVLSKINKYLRYIEEGYWENHYIYDFPKILFIYPNQKIRKWLIRTLQERSEEEEIELPAYLGSRIRIERQGIDGHTWEAT